MLITIIKVLVKLKADQIVFLLRHRHSTLPKPDPVSFDSQLAEPMRQALQGHSGTLIGLDYRGAVVLAAYEPVAILNLGIVAKIDRAEVRAPFIYTGFIAVGITFLIIGIGVMTFLRLVNPLIRQVENRKQELQLSEKRYKSLVHSIDGVVWEAEPNTFQFTFISQPAQRFFGYPLEDWLTQPTFWADHIHPDDKAWATGYCTEATAKQQDHDFEYRMITAENGIIWVRELVTVVVENDQTVKLCGVMLDITERKAIENALQKAHHTLQALTECRHVLLQATDEATLLNEICQVLTHDLGYRLVWIGFAEDNADKTVRIASQCGYQPGYLESITLSWGDNEFGQGPTGIAIRTGQPCLVQDILTEPKYARWRSAALQHGYASSMAMPLKLNGQTIGAINVYAKEPNAFETEILELFEELAQDISYGIKTLRIHAERQQAAEQLRLSSERFRQIFEKAPLGMVLTELKNHANRFIKVNRAMCKMLGYTESEMLNLTALDITDPQDLPKTREVLEKLSNGELSYFQMEKRYLKKNGERLWGNITVSLLYDENKQPLYSLGMIIDITERKQAGKKLRESDTRIRTIVENLVDGVITIDEHGRIESFNPAAEQIFGFEPNEVIGKNVKILMPDPYRSEHDNYLENYQTTGIAKIIGKGREAQGLHKQGSTFPVDLAVSEMWISKQRKFVGIVRDITERKPAEIALKEAKENAESANRAKSEFLANMSHEIRTPMNAVIGFSELLSTLVTSRQQKSYLNSIQIAGKALLRLINDILDLSKIEAGRLEMQYEAVNPYTIFDELKQIFAVKMADNNLEFRVDIEKGLPKALMLDEVRLRQVLFNLIGNAIKFTDSGYIKLSVRHIPNSEKSDIEKKSDFFNSLDLIIAVADTGIGIPAEQQALIFESFRQQDGQSTRKYGGTGLGLAISKRLVEMMSGHISLNSSVGQGSIFEITLPEIDVCATEFVKTPENTFNFKDILFEQAVVLVVDDIESNRHLVKECLSQVNLDVFEAENGQQAVIFAKEYHPDLILMDIRMPIMDGYEATQQLKEDASTLDIPIIALTASVTVDEQTKIQAHGFKGCLFKPINTQELFRELSRYLKHTDKTDSDTAVMDDTAKTLIPEEIVELAALHQTLEEKMLPMWQQINNLIEMESIEAFAEQLIQLGEKHHAQPFIQYAENLRELVDDFDIEGIERMLEAFPEMAKQLA